MRGDAIVLGIIILVIIVVALWDGWKTLSASIDAKYIEPDMPGIDLIKKRHAAREAAARRNQK